MDRLALPLLALTALTACGVTAPSNGDGDASPCDADSGGIELMPGFCASRFAEGLGAARHVAVSADGDVYVASGLDAETEPTLYGLRDGDGDGIAETVRIVSEEGGNGVEIHDGWLYLAKNDSVLRFALTEGELLPERATPEVIVTDLPADGLHVNKSIALDDDGNLYVNLGSATNACQDGEGGTVAPIPCPELETRAGIWRFDASELGQTPSDGERYATGIRNAVALTWNPETQQLLAASNGRGGLNDRFPDQYSPTEALLLPADQMMVVEEGDDFGWPYCYLDPVVGMVRAPVYPDQQPRCDNQVDVPDYALPPHSAPLSMVLGSGSGFPSPLDGGVFLALHGSSSGIYERGPLLGYRVTFVDWTGREGDPANPPMWTFAAGFAGEGRPLPDEAEHRPVGLAFGPDGAMYVTDDVAGTVWRIVWSGA